MAMSSSIPKHWTILLVIFEMVYNYYTQMYMHKLIVENPWMYVRKSND